MEVCIVFFWAACGVTCAALAGKKGYSPGAWLVLGFLFGIFAVVAMALLPDKANGQGG